MTNDDIWAVVVLIIPVGALLLALGYEVLQWFGRIRR